jgi:hypothetical protein
MYYLSRNFTDQPEALKFFFMGIFIATVAGLILNNYFKISMHAMGVGGLAAAVVLASFFYETANGIPISIALVITGLVCTARIVVSDHSLKEIYTGLFVGIACQLIAYMVVM